MHHSTRAQARRQIRRAKKMVPTPKGVLPGPTCPPFGQYFTRVRTVLYWGLVQSVLVKRNNGVIVKRADLFVESPRAEEATMGSARGWWNCLRVNTCLCLCTKAGLSENLTW